MYSQWGQSLVRLAVLILCAEEREMREDEREKEKARERRKEEERKQKMERERLICLLRSSVLW